MGGKKGFVSPTINLAPYTTSLSTDQYCISAKAGKGKINPTWNPFNLHSYILLFLFFLFFLDTLQKFSVLGNLLFIIFLAFPRFVIFHFISFITI